MRQGRLVLPSKVASRVDLDAGERPLAWALGPDEQWYVGTGSALHLVHGETVRRIGWERIERAHWHSESSELVIVEVAGLGEDEARTQLAVVQPGQLLELLRERVTKSVVINMFAAVHGRRGLSVIGRRSPSSDGQVTWSYLLAEGLDPDDPEVQTVAARTLSQAEAELAGL